MIPAQFKTVEKCIQSILKCAEEGTPGYLSAKKIIRDDVCQAASVMKCKDVSVFLHKCKEHLSAMEERLQQTDDWVKY